MKIHRFYTPDIELTSDFWFKNLEALHQWNKVLRFRAGQQVVLFDGIAHDKLYEIIELSAKEAHLQFITEYKRQLPKKDVYLFWSLLKKDKNDWVLQKCTELGVSHFVPLIADRSEKTGFNSERALKIVIEAAEQCGRSDIPAIRDAMHVQKAVDQYKDKVTIYICEQSDEALDFKLSTLDSKIPLGVLIGPEGGWSDPEKAMFTDLDVNHINLHDFTLRAETAAVTASSILLR